MPNTDRRPLIEGRAARLERAVLQLREHRHRLVDALQVVESSKFWRLRNAWFALKRRLGANATGPLNLEVLTHGISALDIDTEDPYDRWRATHDLSDAELRLFSEIAPLLSRRPTVSVLLPVYNPPCQFLANAIESVLRQIYPYWELCIADDASTDPEIEPLLRRYAESDERVKITFRTDNGHVARATNSALAMASGEFIALLDHDDELSADALFRNALVINRDPNVDLIYSDEDKIDTEGRRSEPYFKPDWSPDSLLSRNYISHLGVYRRAVVEKVGGFRPGFEGSQDYDLALRVTEHAGIVAHIPEVLYHWRVHPGSTAADRGQKSYAYAAAQNAIRDALYRRDEPGTVESSPTLPGTFTVRYIIRDRGKATIIVPTRNHGADVDRCLASIFAQPSYENFEVLLVDNGSDDEESCRIFRKWQTDSDGRVRVVRYDVPFNFSYINNRAVAESDGTYLVFLNNDTEVVSADWLSAMIEQAQRPSIGAVGAKLLYDDGTVQHGGVIVGLGGVAGHSHKRFPSDAPGYFGSLQTATNFSAVTAACLALRRDAFDAAGGFDEELAIAFNDVDLCLRLLAVGYFNIYLPHVILYHHESKSRGAEDTPEKRRRFAREKDVMRRRWSTAVVRDRFYNPNLTLDTEDFAIGP